MTDIHIIKDNDKLAEKCKELKKHPYLTIDTEFMRRASYWPQLCLVQIGYDGQGVLIDPHADKINLEPLFELLAEPNIMKIFHAGRQDIEIFHHLSQACPKPLFDTQIAAMACGFSEAVSYELLVKSLLGETVDKSSRVTDWAQRPLTQKQKDYALGDVTHLCTIYHILDKMLKQKLRYDWVVDEFELLTQKSLYENPPDLAWRNLKFSIKTAKQLRALKILAAWRERVAQNIDRPRSWVLRDEILRDLSIAAANQSSMDKIDGLPKNLLKIKNKDSLTKAFSDAKCNALSAPLKEEEDFIKNRGKKNKKDVPIAMMKLLLKSQADYYQVASKLIATSKQIEDFAFHPENASPIKQGWRYEIYGRMAGALLNGEIALTLEKGKAQIIKTTPHAPKKA